MCGIFGRVGRGDPSALSKLACLSQVRGWDAGGVAWRSGGRFLWDKRPGAIRKLLRTLPPSALKADIVIGHTRLATSGSPSDNMNNHPHVGRRWLIVHNGIITNAGTFKRHGQCDSEAILCALEQSRKGGKRAVFGAVKRLRGLMACAAVYLPDASVYVWVDDWMDLCVAQVGNATVFASEKAFIKKAYPNAKGAQFLPRRTLARLTADGIAECWQLPHPKWHWTATVNGKVGQRWYDYEDWEEDVEWEKKDSTSHHHVARIPSTPVDTGTLTDLARGWQALEDVHVDEMLSEHYGTPIAYKLTHGSSILCPECAAAALSVWSDGVVAMYPGLDIKPGDMCDSCRLPLRDSGLQGGFHVEEGP